MWETIKSKKISPRKKLILAKKKTERGDAYVVAFKGGNKSYIIDKGYDNIDFFNMRYDTVSKFSDKKLVLAYKDRRNPY